MIEIASDISGRIVHESTRGLVTLCDLVGCSVRFSEDLKVVAEGRARNTQVISGHTIKTSRLRLLSNGVKQLIEMLEPFDSASAVEIMFRR